MRSFVLLAAIATLPGGMSVATQDAVPPCLSTCMTKVTHPCDSSSLPSLVDCLNQSCGSSEQDQVAFNVSSMLPDIGNACSHALAGGTSNGIPAATPSSKSNCTGTPSNSTSPTLPTLSTTPTPTVTPAQGAADTGKHISISLLVAMVAVSGMLI